MSRIAQGAAGRQIPLGPSYFTTFGFEENFDVPKTVQFFKDYVHIPFILALGIYLSMIYIGQKIMANREPIKAKKALILWNFSLAVFSIIGFSRIIPEFIHSLTNHGFEHSICNNSYLKVKPAAFWIYLFVLSKGPELVDTLFLVLRKQKLMFLHVYHHATVLIFSWFIFLNQVGAARWFCTMNFGVHSVMYTYFALKGFPNLITIPKWVSMLITIAQTLQMVAGTYVVASAGYIKLSGKPCDETTLTTILGLVIYISYLFLFSHFFYKSYCSAAPPRSARNDKKKA